jgi:hypothetical protein
MPELCTAGGVAGRSVRLGFGVAEGDGNSDEPVLDVGVGRAVSVAELLGVAVPVADAEALVSTVGDGLGDELPLGVPVVVDAANDAAAAPAAGKPRAVSTIAARAEAARYPRQQYRPREDGQRPRGRPPISLIILPPAGSDHSTDTTTVGSLGGAMRRGPRFRWAAGVTPGWVALTH